MATNIEEAMQLALSTFPSEGARRILLISDGNENRGHALTEALRARERGVAVFTVPAGGTAPLPVKVESVASPQDVFSGERFTLSLGLDSAGPRRGANLGDVAGPGNRIHKSGFASRKQCRESRSARSPRAAST